MCFSIIQKIYVHTCHAKLPYFSKKCILVCFLLCLYSFTSSCFLACILKCPWVLEKCYWNKQIRYMWWRKLIKWIWFHCIEQTWRHSQTSHDSRFSGRHNCVVLIDLFSLLSLKLQRWSIQDYKSFTVKMDSIITTQLKMRCNLFITDRRRGGKIQEKDSEIRLKEKHMASRQSLVMLTFLKCLLGRTSFVDGWWSCIILLCGFVHVFFLNGGMPHILSMLTCA